MAYHVLIQFRQTCPLLAKIHFRQEFFVGLEVRALTVLLSQAVPMRALPTGIFEANFAN